jgi:HSP20 family protein
MIDVAGRSTGGVVMALLRRAHNTEVAEPLSRFDRMFEEWTRTRPWAAMAPRFLREDVIRVDEFIDDGTLVIRAELPDVDPERDVEISVAGGVLHITAERRTEKTEEKEKGYVRRELRCGSFARTLSLPEGASEDDVEATYTNGMLEIRVPMPATTPEATKIPISTS